MMKKLSIINLYNEEFKKDISYLMLDNEVFDWGPDPEELQNAIKMINHNKDLKETILNSIIGHFVNSFSEFVGKKMTLDEFMQQKALERGYEKTPLRKIYNYGDGIEEVDPSRTEDYLTTINPAWAKRVLDEGEGYSNSVLQNVEQQLKNEYYADPSNFIQTRETPYNQGVNTFNEGNEDQKRILDQINTGQLKIVPVSYEVGGGGDSGPELRTGYELKDARTGQTIPQQVIPIDAEKGIFNVLADDRNSSGYFNNYVSTDPKGFVNPVVSPEQSQYASRANSSADFYRNSLLSSLAFTGLAFPGIGEAIGAATGLGTVGSNVALNTGINALKQAITGNFDPLALATSAALSYGSGALGADGTDVLTADDLYTGQAMTNLANSGGGGFSSAYTTPVDNPVYGDFYDTKPLIDPYTGQPFGSIQDPLVDNYMDGFTSTSETGLATLPDEGMQPDFPDQAPRYDFSPETPVLDVSPELDPTGSLATSGGLSISPMQALRGLSLAKGLLGSGQESAAAPATQFRGTRRPQGEVDYSGILNLLQMRSPQRTSLLG
jgi:hypothetical protein